MPVLVDRLYSIVFLCVILIDDLVDNVHYVSLPSGVRVVVLLCIVVMYHHYLLCRWIIVFCIVGELEDCFYFASLLCVIYIAVLVNGLYYVSLPCAVTIRGLMIVFILYHCCVF